MSTLGFEDYIEPLKLYLHKYREVRDTGRVSTWGCTPHASGNRLLEVDTARRQDRA